MKRFIEGSSREQSTLLPECLDDYIGEDNPVRVVDAFVEQLDLAELGFAGVTPAATGRPSYHPAVLLKIYIYGYLNRIQSSRRLEREAQHNLELMWLTERLTPDFKTIADFRRDNGAAFRNVCRQFVDLCRQLNLFSNAVVAIDGSKFKAVNAHDRNFTHDKLDKRMRQIDECVERYLKAMDTADRQAPDIAEARTTRLNEKIATLKSQMVRMKAIQEQLEAAPGGQVSLTDPDARAMATSNSRGLVGYNVQTAVEPEHHLIVAHEVTNTGIDRRQLSRMAIQAKVAMGTEELVAIADRGYYNGDEIVACEAAGIIPVVSRPMTSSARSEGRFDKEDFVFDPATGEYRCPAGSRLIWRFARVEDGHLINRYWSSDCTLRDQGVDGGDAFPYPLIGAGVNGNELARSCLQLETRDEDHGNRGPSGSHAGLRGPCNPSFWHKLATPKTRRGRNLIQNLCNLQHSARFYTASGQSGR